MAQAKVVGWFVAALALLGALLWFRAHERADAVTQLQLAAERQRGDSLTKVNAIARQAQQEADAARMKAEQHAAQMVAKGKALQVHTDSAVQAASEERDDAKKVLADSQATVAQLRQTLARTLTTEADAENATAAQRATDQRTIDGLLGVLHADSVSLLAHTTQEASLTALNASLKRQLALTEARTPSWLSERFGVGAGYGCVVSGAPRCGLTAAAIVRIWP